VASPLALDKPDAYPAHRHARPSPEPVLRRYAMRFALPRMSRFGLFPLYSIALPAYFRGRLHRPRFSPTIIWKFISVVHQPISREHGPAIPIVPRDIDHFVPPDPSLGVCSAVFFDLYVGVCLGLGFWRLSP